MREIHPDYCEKFACIAGRCIHTCCAGWEIDVDREALARYERVGGDFGRRLRENISAGAQPHFILRDDGRCPFLNRDGLCDIIPELGEEGLCGICAEHPRFHTFLSDRTETGLGLCCEEACRLLLDAGPVRLVGEGNEKLRPGEKKMLAARDEAFRAIYDGSLPAEAGMERLLAGYGAPLPERTAGQWAAALLTLERMDGQWTGLLNDLRHSQEPDTAAFDARYGWTAGGYANLLWYFVYRHFMSAGNLAEAAPRLRFAALGCRVVHVLDARKWERSGLFVPGDRVEHARLFSSEVEYSEENMDALMDMLS
jgi:lysine-N-methylase